MTNSIKISPQRTSFILSVSVILYWATDSYLYLSCHINLMEYSTPVILYITAMILACGVLKHFFFRFITKNELSLSLGKQVRPLPEQIKEIDPECPKDKDINPGNLVVKHDYMDNYEVRVAEIEREKAERQADIKRVIHEYTTFVMTEFLSKEDLEILHENIEYFASESEAGAKTGYVDKALSADKLKTARAVTLAGAITGNTTFDGSKDISIETSLKPLEEQDIPELSLSKIKDAGTAAACNTGTEAGQIPVIGEGGKLNEALIPQQTLTTDNVNEGKKNLYYTNERVTNYLQDTANTFVMDGGNA